MKLVPGPHRRARHPGRQLDRDDHPNCPFATQRLPKHDGGPRTRRQRHHWVVGWFAVRCVFRTSLNDNVFEERVTLWQADSFDAAVERAEEEARRHSDELSMRYLGLAQVYRLADQPGDGAEVFSLIRGSHLDDKTYLDTFFDTGTERQRDIAATTLYRPVGQPELDLIEASGWRRFPARLDWQPIFYPVLSESYATRIASEWNTRYAANGSVGYVTRFDVETRYVRQFEPHSVGGQDLVELWVRADELDDFNDHIVGMITVIAEYRGQPADEK